MNDKSCNNSINLYDNLVVDISSLYKNYPIELKCNNKLDSDLFASSLIYKIYKNKFIPLKYRLKLWSFFRNTNLDLSWFIEYKKYWCKVLGGRPLWNVNDFYFLNNIYRTKFSTAAVPDAEKPIDHLDAWQKPELLYQLFHVVMKESLIGEKHILNKINKLMPNVKSFLEYGSATAPITTSYCQFNNCDNTSIYISDMQTIAFHYATYKFRHNINVKPILLDYKNNFMPSIDINVDIIFCITVFEHLYRPLDVVKYFYNILNTGGYLFFDYIKGDGEGMDTIKGVNERNDVIDYIESKFNLIYGSLSKEQSIGLAIVRKKV